MHSSNGKALWALTLRIHDISFQLILFQHWLDPQKRVSQQIKGVSPVTLYLGVKYYAADPCKLAEEITRYQFFLQVKLDILQGRLPVPKDLSIELAALALQCKCQIGADSVKFMKINSWKISVHFSLNEQDKTRMWIKILLLKTRNSERSLFFKKILVNGFIAFRENCLNLTFFGMKRCCMSWLLRFPWSDHRLIEGSPENWGYHEKLLSYQMRFVIQNTIPVNKTVSGTPVSSSQLSQHFQFSL